MNQPFDQTIPVLTEVVTEPGAERAPETVHETQALVESAPGLPIAPVAGTPDAQEVSAQLETLASDSWTEPEWKLLEQRVAARVLRQLDGALEQHLRDHLEGVMQRVFDGVAAELRASLHKVVEQTVARELANGRQ